MVTILMAFALGIGFLGLTLCIAASRADRACERMAGTELELGCVEKKGLRLVKR